MTAGNVFFLVCSLVTVVGALSTILARSPIRAAVGLLAAIVGIAGSFLLLHAQFLAAIQLIVYAGAVVVLFVFVIMLLGPDAQRETRSQKTLWARAIGGSLFAILGAIGLAVMLSSSGGTEFAPVVRADLGHVESVGGMLFRDALVPFELATILLVVAVVGAVAVARSRSVEKRRSPGAAGETRRLFHGPVHPRDAGRIIPKEPAR